MKICISKLFACILLMPILFTGCGKPQPHESAIDPKTCIYYKGTNGIYAEDTHTNTKKLLVQGNIEFIDRVLNRIYYINNENGCFESIDTISNEKVEYDIDFSSYVDGIRYYNGLSSKSHEKVPMSILIKISNEYIYYGEISKADASIPSWEFVYTRYRIKIDGTDLQKLDNDYVPHLATNSSKVYYNLVQTVSGKKVYRLYESDFDGANEKFLLDNSMHDVKVFADKDFLYYNTRDSENGNVIKRMNIENQKLEIISKTNQNNEPICAIDDNSLYIRNASGEISRINKITFQRNFVFDGETVLAIPKKFMITVRNGYIYLNSDDENYRRILFDDNTIGDLEPI